MSRRAPWQFGYAPVTPAAGPPEPARELVVATSRAAPPARIVAALGASFRAEIVLAREPLFWTRVVAPEPCPAEAIAERLRASGLAIRYVASAERASLALAPAAMLADAAPAWPVAWRARARRAPPPTPSSLGTWFLREGEGGVAAADRARSGTGAGRRLAVVDDDALTAERLDLDAEVLVEIDRAPRHWSHGPLMVAWASGAHGFAGVAPDASARLYVIPKPGRGVLGVALAIARAVFDGADVVLCATYVEGSTSPMLDDALHVAAHLGRRGRGAAVVFPTGRETSSPPGSLHASFSLGLGDPASDPRAFCIAPGARGRGWFLWRDRRGKLRPFGNRGPAVRWLAPGDDLAYPFPEEGEPERLHHAESSGAAAVAAGVLLLVLGANPTLRRDELAAVVDATLTRVPPAAPGAAAPLADPSDLLPEASDADGHDAKHGFGLLHAERACLAARDPVCAALLAMGDAEAARAYADARRTDHDLRGAYSVRLARWCVRALLADREASLALRAALRHLRLVAGDDARRSAHGAGAMFRALGLLLRRLAESPVRASRTLRAEVARLASAIERLTADPTSVDAAERRLATMAGTWFATDRDAAREPLNPVEEPA